MGCCTQVTGGLPSVEERWNKYLCSTDALIKTVVGTEEEDFEKRARRQVITWEGGASDEGGGFHPLLTQMGPR